MATPSPPPTRLLPAPDPSGNAQVMAHAFGIGPDGLSPLPYGDGADQPLADVRRSLRREERPDRVAQLDALAQLPQRRLRELVCELGLPDQPTGELGPGDVVIQRQTNHRWRPLGDQPVRMAAAMFSLPT
mgnify:CR=1 FL=1